MGKPKKLRSSIKALHDVLTGLRLAVGVPPCVQPAKTHSFRDLITSFNSIYYTPHISSSSGSDLCSHSSLYQHCPLDERLISHGKGNEEEAVANSTATASTSAGSSCPSFSSVASAPDNDDEAEDFPRGAINSRRFFFSPCTSKSITGEPSLEAGLPEVGPLGGHPCPGPGEHAEEEEGMYEMLLETDEESSLEEPTTEETWALCKQSIPTAMASRDPYGDFRSSMDEMVAAHGLRDWRGLQELLNCYLHLNERTTHKFIVLAFMDLLVHLASQGKIHKSVLHGSFSTSPLPSPHHPSPHLHSFTSD